MAVPDASDPSVDPWVLLPDEIPVTEDSESESIEVSAEAVPVEELAEIARTMPWLAETAVQQIAVEEVPPEQAPDFFGGAAVATDVPAEAPVDAEGVPTSELEIAAEGVPEAPAVEPAWDETATSPFSDEDLLASDWSWGESSASARSRWVRRLWPVAAIAAAAVVAVALWPTISRLVRHSSHAEAGRAVATGSGGGVESTPSEPADVPEPPASSDPAETTPGDPSIAAPPEGTEAGAREGETRLFNAVQRCLLLGFEEPKEG
ncbi:MAG: hypothetical protein JXP34_01465 [Planctomycetes bacterium]|nr:hypothetical protein [Planctomycetota bacterium]